MTSEAPRQGPRLPFGLGVYTLTVLVTSAIVGTIQILRHGDPRAPMGWDASAHGWAGLEPALALLEGRPLDAAGILWAQQAWPPLFGLIEIPFFFLFGPSALGPLVMIAAAWCLATWATGQLAGAIAGPAARWSAASLALLSPFWVGYAGACMTETVGAAWTVLALWAIVTRRPWWAVTALTAAFFTKFNFGIPLLVPVALASLTRKESRRWMLPWAACFILPMAVWFMAPSKLSSFQDIAMNEVGHKPHTLVGGVALYATAFVRASGPHWVIGMLVVGLAALGLYRTRERSWLVAVLAAVTFGMLAGHPTASERFIYAALPAVFCLAGCGVAAAWERLPGWTRPLLVFLVAGDRRSEPSVAAVARCRPARLLLRRARGHHPRRD